ncbi:MAG: HAD hydrolase-like protein [archaeon]|nr:HAD hydrolase-like protein [archaeon]
MVILSDKSTNISKKKCFLFDFDGTLINLKTNWSDLKNKLSNLAFDKFKHNLTFQPLFRDLNVIRKSYGEDSVFEFHKLIEEIENSNAKHEASLHHHGISVLKKIKSLKKETNTKIWYIIFSNNYLSTINISLDRFNLNNEFDFIIGYDQVENAKPNTEGLEKIFKKISEVEEIDKSEMILIGDSNFDEEVAKKFNIDFYYVDQIIIDDIN